MFWGLILQQAHRKASAQETGRLEVLGLWGAEKTRVGKLEVLEKARRGSYVEN